MRSHTEARPTHNAIMSSTSAPLLQRDSQTLTDAASRNPDFGTFSTSLDSALVPAEDLVVSRAPSRSPPAGPKHPDRSEDPSSSDQIQNLGFTETCKLYPAAIAWSAFVSLGIIMLAFDPQLLGNLYATPQFRKDFGYLYNGDVGALTAKSPFTANWNSTSSAPRGR